MTSTIVERVFDRRGPPGPGGTRGFGCTTPVPVRCAG